MLTPKGYSRFLGALSSGGKPSTRSRHEWVHLLDGDFDQALRHGLLVPASPSEVDGFEGLFDFECGLKRYALSRHNESILAVPVDGVDQHFRMAERDPILFRAEPIRLFDLINKANGFDPEAHKGSPEGVAFARRKVGHLESLCIVSIDPLWLASDARDRWINSVLGDAGHIIVLGPNGARLKWELRAGITIDTFHIPLWPSEFRFPRSLFCRAELGHTPIDAAKIYPEKDILISEQTGEVVIFGTRIKSSKDSRGNLYIRGLNRLGASPVKMELFAKDYLRWNLPDQQSNTVREAKKEAKAQITASFKHNKDLGTKAENLICPRSEDYTYVTKPFEDQKVLLWGVDEVDL